MERGIASYQGYGSTNNDDDGELTSVAFHQPTITDQPRNCMDGPQTQGCYEPLDNFAEPEFSVGWLNDLNQYLIRTCIPPTRKPKTYVFVSLLNIICATVCGKVCALPCFCIAYWLSESVKVMNRQRDYLSARTRSWLAICCNITGLVMLVIGGIISLVIIVFIGMALHGHSSESPTPFSS